MSVIDTTAPPASQLRQRRTLGLVVLAAALAVVFLLSLMFGANPLPFQQVWQVLWQPDSTDATMIVWELRWPRTVVGIAAGAAFAVAGALIQALTRNPLADPGILGVNAGAVFAVTLGFAVLNLTSLTQFIWLAFIGAALATVAVYLIGTAGRRGGSPITLVLAGVALGAVLSGISTLLSLLDAEVFHAVNMWGIGSVARASLSQALFAIIFIAVGLILALSLGSSLNALAMGDDVATALGARIGRIRTVGIVAVTLLAGAATALTGGLGFVGLMVPHIVRWFTGPDQRWVISLSAVGGAVLVLFADVVGRVIARPGEVEVGLVTAVLGAPLLIALVRRRKVSGL